MIQVNVRRSDRVIVSYGESIGRRPDCDLFEISAIERSQIEALLAVPNGGIVLNIDGSFSSLPPPGPPAPLPDRAAFNAAVTELRSTFQTSRSVADVNLCLDAVTVILRRMWRELQ